MIKVIKKHQFIWFSIFTIAISISSWIIAKEQSGTLKMLFTQLGYFGPALVAIILSLVLKTDSKNIKIQSYLPLIVVFACILIIAIFYGKSYYEIRIDKLLLANPSIIALLAIVVAYFVFRYKRNKGNSAIDKLIHIPKTKIIWYVLAVALYPLLKFIGVFLSTKLFPTHFELPQFNFISIIPLFLFSIIFYAAIGEEIGWRGYALQKLQLKFNPFVATIFISIVWTIWHIGYFVLVENYLVQQIPSVVIWTIIASFFATWFYNKTNGNVLVLIFFHASINLAIVFMPHPLILTVIHFLLLLFVLITGRFFKRIKIENIK
jgi:membrane protease YdiL (CAAX protease family)